MTETRKLNDDPIQAMTEALAYEKGEGPAIPLRLIKKDSDVWKCAHP
jgi:hypothetical protein